MFVFAELNIKAYPPYLRNWNSYSKFLKPRIVLRDYHWPLRNELLLKYASQPYHCSDTLRQRWILSFQRTNCDRPLSLACSDSYSIAIRYHQARSALTIYFILWTSGRVCKCDELIFLGASTKETPLVPFRYRNNLFAALQYFSSGRSMCVPRILPAEHRYRLV